MKKRIWSVLLGSALVLPLYAQTVIRHADLQAVDAHGRTTPANFWTNDYPFVVRGILLNEPEEMLDVAPGGAVGGKYQVFVQGVGDDHAGTAVFMNQYGQTWLPDNDYTGAEWQDELHRVMVDTNERAFRPGDLVEVMVRAALEYNGKVNINEGHRKDPANDFEFALLQKNAGLPRPAVLRISDLVATDNVPIFDPDRARGGERWQGMRVRLDGIKLADTNGWDPAAAFANRLCTVSNQNGLTFSIRLPRTDLGPPPGGWFSVVGILNQENGYTNGYEVFVQSLSPEISIANPSGGGMTVSFDEDYEGYIFECSDDAGGSWRPVDATPKKVIVIEDEDAPSGRFYRLRLPEPDGT